MSCPSGNISGQLRQKDWAGLFGMWIAVAAKLMDEIVPRGSKGKNGNKTKSLKMKAENV